MKLTVKKPYLILPVNTEAALCKLLLTVGGECVCECDLKYDAEHPDFYAYLDVRALMGQTAEASLSSGAPIMYRFSSDIDREDVYREPFRPVYHFTEKNGWNNDPNGLVKCGDTYHMFYQQNPAGPEWGNMHWGHAVSKDMLHWEQQPTALFPDAMGTMFSGSGIVDTEGKAGFGRGALLFFYTAAGGTSLRSKGQPFTQCLAVSSDGGKTFFKYDGNPVIPHMEAANRDPKVIFCEELDAYVCALYLTEHRYTLLSSQDLLHWTQLQTLELPGDGECPDFYPLTADDGKRKWVFSGASARYLVGDIKDGRFCPTQPVRGLHTGSIGYAAQTFSTLPDGRRIGLAWERTVFPPHTPFRSQMSIPMVHTLEKDGEGYEMIVTPAEEVETLRTQALGFRETDGTLTAQADGCAYELALAFPKDGEAVTLTVSGQTLTADRERGVLSCGDSSVPMTEKNGEYRVRLFADTASVELFTGAYFACFSLPCTAETETEDGTVTVAHAAGVRVFGWQLSGIFGD